MFKIMNPNSSLESPVRTHESFGEFMKPKFSPSFTSSPYQSRNDSSDFIPFGPSSPRSNNRGRGRWRGHRNRSMLSNASSSGHGSFSSCAGQRQNSFNSNLSQRSSPYKPNNSYGSWRGRGGNKGHQKNTSQNCDITSYYHPSMLHDPWAELEEKLNNSECSSSQSLSVGTEAGNELQSSDTESSVIIESSVESSPQESVS